MNKIDAENAIKVWDKICERSGKEGLSIPDKTDTRLDHLMAIKSRGYLEALAQVEPVVASLRAVLKEIETAESMDCFISYEDYENDLSQYDALQRGDRV